MRLREVVHLAVRGAITLGAAVAASYAGLLLLLAVAVARDESMWQVIYVYDYGASEFADSRGVLSDMYAQPPLGVWGWLGLSAIVVAAWAIVVCGLWLIAWMMASVRRGSAYGSSGPRPTRLAVPVFLWGVAVLSAYALAIYLWNWLEWKHLLDGGLILPGDPKPGPDPAFDPWQIPFGIVTFCAVAAIALVVAGILARRRRAVGTSPSAEA